MTRGAIRMARSADGTIEVDLPKSLRRFVAEAALAVRRTAEDPAAVGHGRIMRPLEETAEDDDPLVTLERQSSIEEICALVEATARNERLTDDEADAWMKVLSLTLAIRAGQLGLTGDDDPERLDASESEQIRFLQALLVLLVDALMEPGAS